MEKNIISSVAILLTFVAFIPYIRAIKAGTTRPHVFSWIIWGSTTFIVFLAQISDGGGVGAWAIGVSGLITMYIAFLAFRRRSSIRIRRPDWVFFYAALISLPIWYFSSDPMWTVLILTTIDVLGFGPTFRKSYECPYEENLTLYAVMTIRNLLVLLALENYSVTTAFFPAMIASTTTVFILMTLIRRMQVPQA